MLNLILTTLATYALSRMVALEEGPFGVFTQMRGAIDPDQLTWRGRGINCPFCVAFWIGWLVPWLVPDYSWLFALATIGGSMFLHSVSES